MLVVQDSKIFTEDGQYLKTVQGMIETPLWAARLSPDEQKAHFQKVGAGLPVGRAGLAEDVAHACRFLMENGFTTGATLDVDGGQR